jgi:hypothetical protein
MERNKKILEKIIIGLFFLLAACTAEEGPVFTEIDIIDISYSADIQPIFNNNCIVCHNQSHQTGLDLRDGSSYNLLVNIASTNYSPNLRIEPFSTENSVLWHKIKGDGVFGGIMPAIEGPLSNFEIEKIKAWIEFGALNN